MRRKKKPPLTVHPQSFCSSNNLVICQYPRSPHDQKLLTTQNDWKTLGNSSSDLTAQTGAVDLGHIAILSSCYFSPLEVGLTRSMDRDAICPLSCAVVTFA